MFSNSRKAQPVLRASFTLLLGSAMVLGLGLMEGRAQSNPWTVSGSNIFNNNTGNVGVGSGATNPGSLFVVSSGSSTPPAPLGSNVATFANLDGNPTRVTFDSFGTWGGTLTCRLARGTAASPSSTQLSDILGAVTVFGYGSTHYSPAGMAQLRFAAAQNWTDAAQGTYISFVTTINGTVNPVEVMRIDNTGFVGIGTITPTEPLDVNGNALVTGTVTSGSITSSGNITAASGTISGAVVKATYQDVAEWVPAAGALGAGTVVVLDPDHSNRVMASKAAYDTAVAGVISATPGVALGQEGEGKALVATTGRVRVRVDASPGAIRVGDLLVTSDKPGVAMKSVPVEVGGVKMHRPGTLIGKALEPLASGAGEILVLLSLQ